MHYWLSNENKMKLLRLHFSSEINQTFFKWCKTSLIFIQLFFVSKYDWNVFIYLQKNMKGWSNKKIIGACSSMPSELGGSQLIVDHQTQLICISVIYIPLIHVHFIYIENKWDWRIFHSSMPSELGPTGTEADQRQTNHLCSASSFMQQIS